MKKSEIKKKILINSFLNETRVAVLENDQLFEFYIDNEYTRGIVGNIYKGRVENILEGYQRPRETACCNLKPD